MHLLISPSSSPHYAPRRSHSFLHSLARQFQAHHVRIRHRSPFRFYTFPLPFSSTFLPPNQDSTKPISQKGGPKIAD
ncbi:hypothetical protein LguiA_025448 [Lonicera macranthoides]